MTHFLWVGKMFDGDFTDLSSKSLRGCRYGLRGGSSVHRTRSKDSYWPIQKLG